MALPGESLDGIKTVYSHHQALAQCEEFLKKLNVEIVPIYDTAGSAKRIKEGGLRRCAAVAGQRAAQIYGLQILAERIETNVNNYTKFFVISKQKAKPAEKSKTSLVFSTKNIPGALYACLGVFATRNINLTKLESRPSRNKLWEYIFYVDFEGHLDEEACHEAVTELERETNFIKILGSYPRADD
jgi:prephenate dehydratase